MGSLPLAFSVHHFISSVGADAGFASIIGLAILILLYFAQARETASLRAHAHDAADRIHELEARLAQVAQSQRSATAAAQASAAPASRAAAVAGAGPIAASRGPAQRPAFAGAPVAPAGVAAPSLSAATKLIPTPAAAGAVALTPGAPPDANRVGAPAPATVAGGAGAGGAGAGLGAGAGSNGSSHPRALGPRPTSAASATQTPPPRVQIRPGGTIPPSRRPAPPPPRGRAQRQAGRSRRMLAVLIGVLALIAVVVVVLIVTGGGGSKPKSTSATTTTTARGRGARRAAIKPGNVAVTVLNGTATPNLAHTVAQSLSSLGYKQAGTPQTATDQTHATTVVGYLPGFKAEAQAVAKSLKLSSASVQPVDQPAQQVACPGPGACTANVIVTAGADLAAGQ